MKRILAVLLAGLMILSLAACGEKKDDVDYKFGMVSSMYNMRGFYNHINETHGDSKLNSVFTQFDNLNAALMALNSKDITALSVDEDEITMDTTFLDDLGADSVDIFEIIMAIEEEFDIEIDNEDAEKIVTVGDAVEQIKKAKAN